MTKLEKLRDELAKRYSINIDDSLSTEMHCEEAIKVGWDKRDAIAKEREAKLVEALELALSFCPKGPVPERLSPEFYHTLDYLEELKLQERVNESRATLTRIEAFANGESK